MSAPWWGRERTVQRIPPLEAGEPLLIPGGRKALIAELRDRISAFTPEWRNLTQEDAGVTLVTVFGELLDPVLARLQRLPEKALVEFLSSAGISLDPARPATAMLTFTASPAAPSSVLVEQGFQVGSAPADETTEQVIWETEREVYVTGAEITEAYSATASTIREVDVSGAVSFLSFGKQPQQGHYLLLGLGGEIAPGPTLNIGLQLSETAGAPPPVALGGTAPSAQGPATLLRWEVLSNGKYEPAAIIIDDSVGLSRSGTVQLRPPRDWNPDRPSIVGQGEPLRWLRLRLVNGAFVAPPRLDFVKLNMVPAIAARTVRDEVLQPTGGPGPKRFRLSQAPVVSRSLVLEVDEGGLSADLFSIEESDDLRVTEDGGSFRRWREVPSFAGQSPDARVYVLDAATGEIEFGDGTQGMEPASGFRNIIARRYQVGGGDAGAVAAEEISALIGSKPFLTGVTNPRPASGGVDTESLDSAKRRGPHQIKARGRAVTTADFGLLARQAPGANVARAFAVAGHHPGFPGAVIPGVVAVFVVPSQKPESQNAEPPIASEETLQNVAEYLSRDAGPVSAQIVAAAPRFHEVRIELTIELNPAADVGDTVRRVLKTLDDFLDPYIGGEAGGGWAFGGAVRHASLLHRILSEVPEIVAVPYLNPVVDGLRGKACEDAPLSPYGLTWPAGHEVIPRIMEVAT